jgi:outer membrane protein assembly factor BamA
MAVTWIFAHGTDQAQLAKPLKSKTDDDLNNFQFQLGQVF